jgi:hypothetical protein
VYSIEDVFGAVVLTVIITFLTIGLIWSLSTSERLRIELKKKEQNDKR